MVLELNFYVEAGRHVLETGFPNSFVNTSIAVIIPLARYLNS